jgi:hypothetical protein
MPYISTIARASANGLGYRGAEPAIGQPFQGGYYAGAYQDGSNNKFYLIVAPKSAEAVYRYWSGISPNISATSVINGSGNTFLLASGGQSPAAIHCDTYTNDGYTDWYLPATWELEICYFNLKPSTATNSIGSGQNPYAIPSRSSVGYTTTQPSQTSVGVFQSGQTQAFKTFSVATDAYFTSTGTGSSTATAIEFSSGSASNRITTLTATVRPVRKVFAGTV